MMKEKKNIDQLFQEKFNGFQPKPSEQVWENIALARAKKDDRKAIPLWWKLGGVAAVLALLFTAGTFLFDGTKEDIPEGIISQEGEAPDHKGKEENIQNTINKESTQESQIVNIDKNEELQKHNSGENEIKELTTNQSNNRFASYDEAQKSVVQESAETVQNRNRKTVEDNSHQVFANENVVTVNEEGSTKHDLKEKQKSLNPLLKEQKETSVSKVEEAVVSQEDNKTVKEEKGKSLVEEANRIEAEKAEEVIASVEEDSYARWGVGAIAAPVYYGDFGGSGVDTAFEGNNRSGNVNVSYGVQVSYNVSPKLKVRTGVSNVDLSYNTENIGISPDISARQLKGIDYSRNAQFLSIGKVPSSSQEFSAAPSSDIQGGSSRFTPGELEQRVGYVEVPLEAVYTLSDKRLGVEVIGGVSTLFLNNNEIALEADNGQRTPLGSSTGANDVSFTTNVGLGVHYKVTDKVQVKMEPSFKYQVNAFDKDVVDFKPYYLGLYTGVSYRF